MNHPPATHGFEVVGRASVSVIRRAPGYSGERALTILKQAIEQRAFPGAVFAVSSNGEIALQGATGRLTDDETSEDVTLSTVFDLASVSKVVATTSMAMLLYDRGKLDLAAPVVEILPEFAGDDPRRKQITVEMLLGHSSGLPAYVRLFEQATDRASLLRLALQVPLEAAPETRTEYSDIGFIILGESLQRIAGESLDKFCAREIFAPLKMKSTCFNPPPRQRGAIPPTRDEKDFRHRMIQGEVHDENAGVLGGVAGHAGVFSNTSDLMKFADCILERTPDLFRSDTIKLFTRRRSSPPGTSRALGWDTPSSPSQSGKHFSKDSFGHLGYTGTSLWIDRERQIAVALLTNRTWPDNQSQLIKQVRPQFHDAVMEELLAP